MREGVVGVSDGGSKGWAVRSLGGSVVPGILRKSVRQFDSSAIESY